MNGLSQEGYQTIEEYNSNEQLTLFSLQDLAVKHTVTLSDLKKQLKTISDMVKGNLDNNSSYHAQEEKVKDEMTKLKQIKTQIQSHPNMVALEQKVKGIKAEIKEKNDAISDYTLEVIRQSGKTEFEKDGDVYEIKTVAKLIRRKP